MFPINIVFNELANDRDVVGLKDSENMGTSFSGPQGDKGSLLFQILKASEVFISIGSTLHKSISTIRAPQNETCHSEE